MKRRLGGTKLKIQIKLNSVEKQTNTFTFIEKISVLPLK